MRYALVAALCAALACVGCGQSTDDTDPTSDPAEATGGEFELSGTVTADSETHSQTRATDRATNGEGFSLSGRLSTDDATRVCTGEGWRMELSAEQR